MSTTGTTLAQRVRYILQDSSGTRWTDAEILGWINAAQVAIVALKPDASATFASVTLAVSTAKQAITSGGLRLLDILGNTSGAAVRRIDRTTLDMEVPSWYTATGAATVKHWMFDPALPTTFWVYPPQPSSSPGSLDIIYSAPPTALGALSDTMYLADTYADAVVDYVCYRAFMKDADNQAAAGKSANHYQSFTNFMSGLIQSAQVLDPNQTGKT